MSIALYGAFFAAEVADHLGMHEKQSYRLVEKGGLLGTRVTGKWLFQKVLVDEVVGARALATLELSLLVTRAVAGLKLKQLGIVVAGAVRTALARAETDGAGAMTAVA